MDGFWSSFSQWFSEKTGSPLYFTYIGYFIAWNWKVLQVIFLESSSLFVAPKIEYVTQSLSITLMPETAGLLAVTINLIANFAWHVVPPAVLTFLSIKYLPYVQKWALREYLLSRFDRKKIFETKQREYNTWLVGQEREKQKELGEMATIKKEQVKQKEAIKKATTKEEEWIQDFVKLESHSIYPKFKQLTDAVYSNRGGTHESAGFGQATRIVDSDMLALAHSMGIISISGKSNLDEKIEFTDKGRFFVSRMIDGSGNSSTLTALQEQIQALLAQISEIQSRDADSANGTDAIDIK